MYRYIIFILLFLSAPLMMDGKPPELTPKIVSEKLNEMIRSHAEHNQFNSMLAKRSLQNYLEELDPNKTYFIESDLKKWLDPSDELIKQILIGYNQQQYPIFEEIFDVLVLTIERRRKIDEEIDVNALPLDVKPEEFKDMTWVSNENELMNRIKRIKALQLQTAEKLNDELREKSIERLKKRQIKFEEDFINQTSKQKQQTVLTKLLKSTAAAMDTHTAYLTPEEATQFMISVQQRLFGIGAQLRDDLNGFTVVKIIEGGPAAIGGDLKAKDRIIAVNGEPVVGMDIIEAVELIRGEKGTPVTLTVIRQSTIDGEEIEENLDVSIIRDEVVLKETRLEDKVEPFGSGSIGYIKLYSFYQDPTSSSSGDISKAIQEMKKKHNLEGLILDLRYNSGGLLSQAIDVTGLFITKGIVVSIKDNTGKVQHLRNLDGTTAWDGPLIVLVNRASASASEIVAQTLQDYGRAIVVGDDHTFGKGTFQTFTLNTTRNGQVNPEGEYKVTRGVYYTVSGKTPQLSGVITDITLPGPLSEMDIGEKYSKFPLENNTINPNFDDDLNDIPVLQRDRIRMLYKFNLQPKLNQYTKHISTLKENAEKRIEVNKNYQNFLKELKKEEQEEDDERQFGENDLQLMESYNIMKDLIFILQGEGKNKRAA